MRPPLRTLVLTAALAGGLVACGSSGGRDGAPAATSTSTPAATTTTAPTTTGPPSPTSTTAPITTTTVSTKTPDALPACQVLLQEYTDVFTPDDLAPVIAFFRKYAPLMPDDVGAASLRLAQAYEDVGGDISKLNFDDVDLSADAQTFSDWTNAGCPAG